MASEIFVRSVVGQMDGILYSERECGRLALCTAIIRGWRGYLEGDRKHMIDTVISVASDNHVALDYFEGLEDSEHENGRLGAKYAKACAEAILVAVDNFCRQETGLPWPDRRLSEAK
jgi:hypothetical protein